MSTPREVVTNQPSAYGSVSPVVDDTAGVNTRLHDCEVRNAPLSMASEYRAMSTAEPMRPAAVLKLRSYASGLPPSRVYPADRFAMNLSRSRPARGKLIWSNTLGAVC